MYRKFTADYLFDGFKIQLPGSVLVTDETGIVETITTLKDAGDGVEHINGLLCPGFVNAHCHLELSHMLGHIPEKTGLVNFLLKVIFERSFTEEAILSAIEKAEDYMLQKGIVAVGDICNTTNTISQKQKQRLQYHNFIETAGFINAGAEARFDSSQQVYDAFAAAVPSNSLAPHAPYSVSPALFGLINNFPANALLTIHNQEATAENELFQKKGGDFIGMYQTMNIDIGDFTPTGKTSLQSWLPYLNNYQSLILVHDVCTSAADIEFEKEHTKRLRHSKATNNVNNFEQPDSTTNQTSIHQTQTPKRQLQTVNRKPLTHYCLCPNANLYITGKLPDVDLLIAKGCSIVLGTDSLASNRQLSILAEMKTIQNNFANVPLATMLQWATSNGAKALQMDSKLGSFEKGKRPGLVQVDEMSGLAFTAGSSSKRIL